MKIEPQPPRLRKTREAAEVLEMSESFLRKLSQRGYGPAEGLYRFGRSTRWDIERLKIALAEEAAHRKAGSQARRKQGATPEEAA